jgi:LCP family protein required for cell wall assembly
LSRPSPNIAALLSFIFPGLGQAYAGEKTRGLLLAVPMIGFLLLVVIMLAAGTFQLLGLFVRTESLLALLLLNLALFAYRMAAMFDAYRLARDLAGYGIGARRGSAVLLASLLALSLVIHGVPEYLGARAVFFLEENVSPPISVIPSPSFEPEPTDEPTPTPSPSPSPSPPPTLPPGTTPPPPTATPRVRECPTVNAGWAGDGRLNLLLIGADEGPGRTSLRTDTMILLSVELATCRAALMGFPRNLQMVPLPSESKAAYPGGRFPDFLFGLWRRAMEQPQSFPGNDEDRGWRAITGAIQEMAGVPIDGLVAVNLNGFVQVVDLVGGLYIDVPRRLRDDNYPREDGSGRIKLDIRRGCQLLEGWKALAYARSRHQDDDYQRMRRQQLVLTAARRQLDPLALLPRVNDLFDIAGGNIWLYIDGVPELARVAAAVDPDRIQTMSFSPPGITSPLDDDELRTIRRTVRRVFDNPDPEPSPTPTGSPAPSCPPAVR